jgi:hypothetical protein
MTPDAKLKLRDMFLEIQKFGKEEQARFIRFSKSVARENARTFFDNERGSGARFENC